MDVKNLERRIEQLVDEIEELRGSGENLDLREAAQRAEVPRAEGNAHAVRTTRLLKGHFGKVYAMEWAGEGAPHNIVSASQDGKLIVWNAFTTHKVHAIALRSAWVMTCAYSQTGRFVACGGLDNVVTGYKLGSEDVGRPAFELVAHEGYLSCVQFISDSEAISSSGDGTVITWDVESRRPTASFADHLADVMSVSVRDAHTFVSGSCDALAKMWDTRVGNNAVFTFNGHESDVNSVSWMHGRDVFCTGSDDSAVLVFDVRSCRSLQRLADDKILSGITSVTFSRSGRYTFAGYDDGNAIQWDTLYGSITSTLDAHEGNVSCLGLSADGKALGTASWDFTLRTWA